MQRRKALARHEKPRRGELIAAAPVDFVKPGDRLKKDTDRGVQEAIILGLGKAAAHVGGE
jgi:hypothetical protein